MPTCIRAPPRGRSSTDFEGERLDYWVTGFGTGGTLKGVARVLAKERPETKIIVCEPADAQMLASGTNQERKSGRVGAGGHPPSSRTRCKAGARILFRSSPAMRRHEGH